MAGNGSEITWRPAIAELVGTFLFVFVGAGTVVVTGGLAGEGGGVTVARLLTIAAAHGLTVALLTAALGHLSGGHINPSVTVAAMVTRRISMMQGMQFITFQLVGGILAALLLAAVLPGFALGDGAGGSHALGAGVVAWQGFIIEVVLTAIVVLVIFGTAMDAKGPGTIAPLVIGLAVMVCVLIGFSLTGASMNPARSLGPALIAGSWSAAWPLLYILGPLLGGAMAAIFYTRVLQRPES
jgi:MIP family channel proteins